MRGVPRERCAMRRAPSSSMLTSRIAAERFTMLLQVRDGVELEALHDAEAVAQRRGEQARARRGAHQGEGRQIQLDGARRRPLADHDVELIVLHRRIEHFLHHRRQTMDLVDEQHVARLQVGEQGRQVAGPLEHRPGGLAQVHAQFVRR